MAARVQKFTLTRMLLLLAVMIWLPQLLRLLAGVPVASNTDDPHSLSEPSNQEVVLVETQPVSHEQEAASSEDADGFFPLDRIKPGPATLKLTSTLISSVGRTAIINNRAYREGDMVRDFGWAMRVRTIRRGSVLLESDGQLLEIREQAPRPTR